MRFGRRLSSVAAMGVIVAGCGTDLLPVDAVAMPAGSREWIITVENTSNAPAVLVVAEDREPMGALVGSAQPSSVPPRATRDVVFAVPPSDGWAIFVNPGVAGGGALIIAHDVPLGAAGRLPVMITIGPDGAPTATLDGSAGPGWFGN